MENDKKRVRPKARRRRKKVKLRWGRIFFAIISIVVIFAGVTFAGYSAYKMYVGKNEQQVVVKKEINKPKTQTLTQQSLDKPMYILLVGLEQLKNNTIHSLYLVSINDAGKQLDIIGIPLDSKIVGRDGKSVAQIKDMYRTGGYGLTKAVVEDIFNIQIPYYIIYNEQSFQEVMDIIGSNKLYVEKDMVQYDESGIDISLLQGYQGIDSTKAWAYMTYEGQDESGIEKVKRQEQFIKNEIKRSWNNLAITEAYDVFKYWDNLETNISTFDAIKFVMKRSTIPQENYHYFILPGAKEVIDNKVYWDINPVGAQRIVGITINYNGGLNDK